MQVRGLRLVVAGLALLLACIAPSASAADTKYGDLTFPQDESAQPASWDYWWGSGNVVAKSGNRYVVGLAFTSFDGYAGAGYQVWPRQGPYKDQSLMTMEGPVEWGHPDDQGHGRYLSKFTVNTPATKRRLKLDIRDREDGFKLIDRWERVGLDKDTYRFRLDQAQAKVHPSGERIRLLVDLRAEMQNPPLLAGGTGRFFYHVPEDFGFPSKGFQYQQAAKKLEGSLHVQQPDGSILTEEVDPKRSTLFMVHESDPPEDIPGGLAVALLTQVHPSYAQRYNLQWPWELIYADLGNGAQLMFDLQAYHDTPKGLLRPVTPQMPTYRVLATLRLPGGESIPLDSKLHAEHLDRRHLDTIASATGTMLSSPVTQNWKFRVSFPGGTVANAEGKPVKVPQFDLGLAPPWGKSMPTADDRGNALTQRVPFDVAGSYGGCPVHGFAWSELLVNWYGWEQRDPWWTGGSMPKVPKKCEKHPPTPPSGTPGELNPPPEGVKQPDLAGEGCTAQKPGTTSCEYTAAHEGGLGGTGAAPGAWTVTIDRPGEADPLVIRSHGGYEAYVCGTIRKGDHVSAAVSEDFSGVYAGDPAICF